MRNPIHLRRMKPGLAGTSMALVLFLTACGPAGGTTNNTSSAAASASTSSENTSATTMDSSDTTESADGELELTLDELAQYDGKDGQPVYVAVDGIIYDLSHLDLWEGGEHNGNLAGRDLTKEIDEDSPHGRSMLERAKIVGKLVDP